MRRAICARVLLGVAACRTRAFPRDSIRLRRGTDLAARPLPLPRPPRVGLAIGGVSNAPGRPRLLKPEQWGMWGVRGQQREV